MKISGRYDDLKVVNIMFDYVPQWQQDTNA